VCTLQWSSPSSYSCTARHRAHSPRASVAIHDRNDHCVRASRDLPTSLFQNWSQRQTTDHRDRVHTFHIGAF
jgi:hypothetical protein